MARAQDRGVLADRVGKVTGRADDDVADVAVRPQPDAASGLGHAGRVLIATFGTWLAFVAILGALPWNSADDGDRALIGGAVIVTAVALFSIPVSLRWRTGWAVGFAWLGLAAALFGMGLATVQVVRVLLVPAGV